MIPSWLYDNPNMPTTYAGVPSQSGTVMTHNFILLYSKEKYRRVQGWGLEHALGPLPTQPPGGLADLEAHVLLKS